ncbi:hypothetical protein BC828DRAFT_299124 [Blastocladiella britannica]|nr:hypothetical protein BC828DRAFT_299124 [Blastocladiella britannica]
MRFLFSHLQLSNQKKYSFTMEALLSSAASKCPFLLRTPVSALRTLTGAAAAAASSSGEPALARVAAKCPIMAKTMAQRRAMHSSAAARSAFPLAGFPKVASPATPPAAPANTTSTAAMPTSTGT